MASSRSLTRCWLIASVFAAASGACGSDPATNTPPPVAGSAGHVSEPVDNPVLAGSRAAVSGGRAAPVNSAGTLAAGTAAQVAGSPAAGSGGASGSAGAAGSAGTSSAGAGGAGGDASDDPFGDLFPTPDAPSCDGMLCLEAADCTSFYPDAAATCHFTDCVDFVCK